MMLKKSTIFACACMLLGLPLASSFASSAQAAQDKQKSPQVYEYMLPNGLKVLIKPDHRMPVAMVQVWYKVGGIDESVGCSGMSHMLEHMMFKGTKHVPEGEFAKIVHDLGGSLNAGTSDDFTYYHEMIPVNGLDKVLSLEADRMQNLRFSEAGFLKERDVVMEERRMRYEDKPANLVYEQFYVAAHTGGPYRHLAIGWANDIAQYSMRDMVNWYHQYYGPNNAILVVVGDVNPAHVHHLAKKYFGRVHAINKVEQKTYAIPAHQVKRSINMHVTANVPQYWMAFPATNFREDAQQSYALDVMAALLNGASGLIAKDFVRGKEWLTEGSAYYDGMVRGDSLFTLSATPAPGHSVPEVKEALQGLLTQLCRSPISKADLNRVKARMIADRVYQKDSIYKQALELGYLETVGLGYAFADEYVAALRKVTAKQVQVAACDVVDFDRMTEATLVPEKTTQNNGQNSG